MTGLAAVVAARQRRRRSAAGIRRRRQVASGAVRRLVSLLVALGLVAGACSGGGPGEGQATLRVDGLATVVRSDGSQEQIDDTATIERGDTVTVTAGTALVEFFGGAEFELRAARPGAVDSQLAVGDLPTALAGDFRILAGNPARLAVGDVVTSTIGTARFNVETAVLAVYTGRATTTGGGPDSDVPALRQTTIPTAAIVPLTYDATDPWDRTELGESISVGERLEAIARGYTSDLRVAPSASFFESVLPALAGEPEFQEDLLTPGRAAGETLIGAAIAVQGRSGSFRQRWSETFDFRDQGALWGLVARDQGVSSEPLFDQIEVAIGGSPGIDAPRTTSTTRPSTTTTSIDRSGSSTSTTSTTTTTAPPDENTPLGDAFDLVGALVDEILRPVGGQQTPVTTP